MKKYDHIEVVEKSIDEITVVEKFNPFHDARGRFASSNGFASYSANPNTKAGAMAISRSAAAGHGNTPNVHRQSYGENIKQNANWLGQGKQLGNRRTGSTFLRNTVEQGGGLRAASAVGRHWQNQNQSRAITTRPGKYTQQQQQAQQQPKKAPKQQPKPQQTQTQQQQPQANAPQQTGGLKAAVANVKLGSGDRLAIQLRDCYGHTTTNTKKVANDHDQARVAGKDISKTANISKIKGNKDPIDKMAEIQGWNKGSTVTNDLETFQKAAKKSGYMLIRSVTDYRNETAADICKKTMTDGNASLGGNGGKVYGSGLYMVGADIQGKTGKTMSRTIAASQNESFGYGNKQMMSTIHPNAKIATPSQANQMKLDFYGLSGSDQRRFGNDFGAYIASKGYDGARWHNDATPYVTMYNKSALIFYGEVSDRY